MAFDWIAGLFQSEQTRGLSGDGASAVALDDSNPYYNYRLRRHKTEDDIVESPHLIWYTSQFVAERTGLGTHIDAERGEGVANFTDVLIILSEEDYARASRDGFEGWKATATTALLGEFENFCRREQFARLYTQRALSLKFLREGSEEMDGQLLGLARGEFITGLLPNLYTGPVEGSFPVIGVHLNLPGVWEGYKEIGRLYNDQILFTLGNHWLDNFAHPALQEAALYRLQQYPDGSFVHIVNPDLQDRYQVTSVQQGGTNVLTLATREGHPLAYMVLALIEAPAESAPVEPERPGIAMPVAPSTPVRSETIPPDVAPPMLIDDALQPVQAAPQPRGNKTIIPDAPSERILTFQERGALLQKVHFSNFMAGYDVYISKRGELGTSVENPAAALQVRKRDVSLKAHIDLLVGGSRVSAGSEIPIDGDTTIEIGGERLDYRDLRGLKVDGWPYVGEIQRPASSTYLIWGERYHIGRSRECRVMLPDEPRNDNIHWKPSVGDGATIRARTGEIPKSRFYTDSIMVASEHATIDASGEIPSVVCTARHCYVYVRRDNEVMPLYPSTSGRTPQQMELQPGDEVLIGNQLFQAGFTAKNEATFAAPAAPAPEVRLTADSLMDAISEPDFELRDPEPIPNEGPTPLMPIQSSTPLDVIGMESVMGANLRAVADEEDRLPLGMDDHLPLDFPAEDVGDDPTRPGMVVPRALLEEDEDEEDADLALVEDAFEDAVEADRSLAEPDVDPAADLVQGWDDEEDWEDVTGPPSVPSSPGDMKVEDAVSEPFPNLGQSFEEEPEEDVEAEEPSADQTWNEDLLNDAPLPVEDDAYEDDAYEDDADDEDLSDAEPTEMAERSLQAASEEPAAPLEESESHPTEVIEREAVPRVIFTDDNEAQFELGRPLHIVQSGWTVRGEVVAGNHSDADLIIPENRIVEDQVFQVRNYFRMKIRGRRGHVDILSPRELLIDEADPTQDRYDNVSDITIDVVRRDDEGEEDFVVRLIVTEDRSLPDPRARFVALDYEDPLAAALVTRGLGLDQKRSLELGGIHMELLWDGEFLTLNNYLQTYKTSGGFAPFFIQHGTQRFVTAPENGEEIRLSPGDRFVVGTSVYLVKGL